MTLGDGVQSVDSARLAEALARGVDAARTDPLTILVQVNTTCEEAKAGVPLARVVDETAAIARAGGGALRIDGLMTIGPTPATGEEPDERASRDAFASLCRAAEAVRGAGLEGVVMRELSMGMTGDLEWAIAEGATLVRVGTALFGPRRG